MPNLDATTALARAEALARHGILDPAELDDAVAAASCFCGAPVALALAEDPDAEPQVRAILDRGRSPGDLWSLVKPGLLGRWILDSRGGTLGLLVVPAPLQDRAREGLDATARLLEAALARGEARRERRGANRGPAASTFVPGLVHELRNAAFAFSAVLDAFQARYGGEEAGRHAAALRAALERLTGFIEELGAYGDPRPGPRAPGSLEGILREALAASEPLARSLGVELRLAWEAGPLEVEADLDALRQAFASLVRWALGQGGGDLALLRVAEGEGGLAARGCLEGPGLQVEGLDLARAFEPFYFKAAGLGRLGLPVARRILEAHGGTLAAGAGDRGEVRLAFTLPCR